MEKNSQLRIFLDSVEVALKIGLHAHEKNAPQRVKVDVALYAEAVDYLRRAEPETIIDYAPLYEEISSWPARPQQGLIETYIKDLLAVCFAVPGVVACDVSIRKMDVFGLDQGAGVCVFMRKADWENAA